jgi:hypothetical protein
VEVEHADAPRAEYARRLEERKRREAAQAGRERLAGMSRLAVFVLGLGLLWPVFGMGRTAPAGLWCSAALALAGAVAASVALLVWHDRVLRAQRQARQAAAYYGDGLARLDGAWKGRGRSGDRYRDEKHPYAEDLELFGKGRLFERLCAARTRAGEDRLAAWLRAPASADEVRARQAAVAELRPQLGLREDLAVLGAGVPAGVDFEAVAAWGAAAPALTPRWPRRLAFGLGAAAVACLTWLALWVVAYYGFLDAARLPAFLYLPEPPPAKPSAESWRAQQAVALAALAVLLAEGLMARALGARVAAVLRAVEKRGPDLALLAGLLARLEKASFTAPRLRELRAVLDSPDQGLPSQRIARLSNLIDQLDARRNPMFAPIAYLLMWGTQSAYAIEAWRAESGKSIAAWLAVVGEIEALCSLATYSFEEPADPFPEVVTGRACYDGEGLRHPLLRDCVPNDLRLDGELRVLIVSGSNMSGKSTYLRTAGVNAVLALAGAPVRARRLRLTPLAVGTSMHVHDSLEEGRSRFYAEVLRVRQLVDLTRGPLPLLFLLDEIFAGTNSHDRRLGAESVVRGLAEAGALGLVTTHDLSLTQIADQLGPRAANVHFADHFEGGVMRFDYRLQPGVVRHSNALALMRAVGLKV